MKNIYNLYDKFGKKNYFWYIFVSFWMNLIVNIIIVLYGIKDVRIKK